MTIAAAIQAINDFGTGESTHVSLVFHADKPAGWTQMCLLEEGGYDGNVTWVREVTSDFDLRTFITANSTAWKAVQVFAEQRVEFLFVLDGSDVIGTIFYRDLFKPAFRTCLFALTVELEQKVLQLCLQDAQESWLSLDEDRRRFLEDKYRERTRTRARKMTTALASLPEEAERYLKKKVRDFDCSPREMLEHSYFGDRIEAIKRRNLFPPLIAPELHNALDGARKVRNWSVHPESSDENSVFEEPGELRSFILSCQKVFTEIEKLIPTKDIL